MRKSFTNILISIAVLALAAVACNLPATASGAKNGGFIGGTVTADLNGNGTADGGEAPLDNVIVSLSGCGENKTALSGADGSFQFSDLPAGVCVLEVTKSGWTYSGSTPDAGYPIPVTVDASRPTAVVVYMRPSDQAAQTQPTAASNQPTVTQTPTEIPFTATPEATATPSMPMVAAIDKGVNCRFGPSTKYAATDALLVGSPAPIIGRIEDSSWWQINNPSGGSGKCFVAASVTQTFGNLNGIPVVQAPDPYVTDVKVSVKVNKGLNCTSAHQLDISGTISTNGPTKVEYRWVLTGSTKDETPYETIEFTEAGDQTVTVPGAVTKCGDYTLELQVDKPNNTSGKDEFSINIP